ncbi:efflux RND transporter permease subunit [Noviherbaspirillum massiliense]|uniref:efflux RND transporter permease subunit n=1 Tax=Noviherbaspirillum massiliense TaxID=1465823 RepID=UPI0005508F6B|nr:efflux RND transporter permease subunit [Noviherbaspirillum massiliense]
MNLSELCIRRPVMTVLLSISVIIAGILAYTKIPVAALPSYNTPVINVTANLPGASPETMASSVALPLEKQFSTIAGLSVISSVNTLGNTSITLEFDTDRDIDAAAVDVQSALLRAQRALPEEMTDLPSYRKVNPADAPVLLLALTSPSLNLSDLNDYAENLISPSLSTLNGVAQVMIYGQKRYAVRVEVNPALLNARNISFDDLVAGIRAANANTPVGVLDGPKQTLTIQANQQLKSAAQFADLIIASRNNSPVRLREVAEVKDSYESVKRVSSFNGENAIILAIQRQPDANTVAVVDSVYKMIPRFQAQLPASVQIHLMNDRSVSIREALHDVNITLAITVALVVMVIFLFLRKLLATVIPTLSLPVSLVGAVSLLYAFGYSLDNISLLGITLAVGLVVDDAIVVLENIVRHVENGMAPFRAALVGSKEMSFTIVSISLSLVAVFIPIFFMPGVIGLMFHEFAVVVALSILVSAVVSLTLVPMLCSRYLKPEHEHPDHALGRGFERLFNATHGAYERTLDWALRHRSAVLVVAFGTFALTAYLFITIPKGFFPEEDIGQISVTTEAAEDISFLAMRAKQAEVAEIIRKDPNVESLTSIVGASNSTQNSGRMFINLKPRSERAKMPQVLEDLRKKVRAVPGMAVYFRPVQNLQLGGRVSKSRYQYVLQSVRAEELNEWSVKLLDKLRNDPLFRDVTSDSQLKGLQATLKIDRDKAGLLGVQMADLRSVLYSAFGERQVSTIYTSSNDYQVILEVAEAFKRDESAFDQIYVRTKNGNLVPLTSFATVERTIGPTAVNHQGQLQAITLSFNLAPDVPLGEAAARIEQYQSEIKLPPSVITSYGGDAAVFKDSQSSQAVLLVVALLVIYVLLGVLYESFIHPLTILAGLPSAAVGALLVLRLFGMDLTLIATIGILMLIGIVKKNAIMMIDFALDAQRNQGMSPQEAIRKACLLRFRPILMTTFAALMGALPIALGLGAGAELRQPLGLAVVGGLLFSQVITLYITPVIYLYLDRYSGKGPITADIGAIPAPHVEPVEATPPLARAAGRK